MKKEWEIYIKKNRDTETFNEIQDFFVDKKETTMKPVRMNGFVYYFEVFITSNEPFILMSTTEYPSEGLSKIYFLRKYSMKYAMEDFVKYEAILKERNTQKNNEVR
jgi:hypothetical protein